MGLLRNVALVVLAISFLVFVALFGRLPAFRKTPIGFMHRAIWIYIPHGFARIDSFLTGGRLLSCCTSFGKYVMYENHPLVLIFFVALLSVSELVFVPRAWPRLGTVHRVFVPIAVSLPYAFLYVSVTTKSFITSENIKAELARYPYDRVLFHPGNECSTCHLLKPARSKHCSTCNACVSKHDHHCIWLSNCVGRNNHRYFLGLLFSLTAMLVYGIRLGYIILDANLQTTLSHSGGTRWSLGLPWSTFINYWGLAIADDIRIGAVFLLAMMTAPLAFGFFAYHIYLVWAGMTTNETAKWGDWKEDIADGLIYSAKKSEVYRNPKPRNESIEPKSSWPGTSEQVLIVTGGEPPRIGFSISTQSNCILQPEDESAPIDPRFRQIRSIRSVENIYDLGFWRNLRDTMNLAV